MATKRVPHMRALAIQLGAGGIPPTEFRLFVAGWNETENGRFLFDAEAASATIAAYEKWGVDLAIDLEHQMLEPEIAPDPTAKDARGWCKLELRPDGSLWAVNVTWTADGAARLTEKRQRYISPAFGVDPETSRVTSILNVAITAIPATHDTPALMAASVTSGASMDPKLIQDALDALIAGDDAKCAELLKNLVASAAGGDDAGAADDVGSTDDTQTGEIAAASNDGPERDKEDKEAVVAATARLARLTGHTTLGAIVDEVETWRTSHLKLEAETAKLAKERQTLEMHKRKENAMALQQLGAETPFTSGLSKGKLCKRLLDEPLDEQTARVAALLSARGGKLPAAPLPPPAGGAAGAGSVEGLTPRQMTICKEMGTDPATFLRLQAQRDSVKTTTT